VGKKAVTELPEKTSVIVEAMDQLDSQTKPRLLDQLVLSFCKEKGFPAP
jgi:hypothetical protein